MIYYKVMFYFNVFYSCTNITSVGVEEL